MCLSVNIVILAAGKGTRMHSDLPKVMHPLGGRPLLSHVLETASQLSTIKPFVVYGFGGQSVIDGINDSRISWVEQAEQRGTGHALMQALPHLSQAVAVTLVLLGDVPLLQVNTCRRLLQQAAEGSVVVLTVEKANPKGYGRILRKSGQVQAIVEEKDANDEQRELREVNTGIMAIPTIKLENWLRRLKPNNAQDEYYLTDVIMMAVADGVSVIAEQTENEYEALGINSKTDLAQAERIYQRRIADQLTNSGVTLMDAARFDVRGQLDCGRDVSIDVGCVFEGSVTLGNNVHIGPYCVIRNAHIAENVEIKAYSHIDDAEVGKDSRIGPFARLRPGTMLAEKTHVGNFVEIKNSDTGVGSKINHLSYIGDSTLGRDVNVGAGTITCNYDGKNKHRTIVGDGVFIGSDTQLVAPVEIGANATIGAGSTITENAPAGELTLSRGRQITISGWKRPEKIKS